MLETLITNKTRLKILLKFFLNKKNTSYLRNLESEFGESSNAIRIELNRLETAGLLISQFEGNKKYFKANDQHPIYSEINSILHKSFGIDTVIKHVVTNIEQVDEAYLIGDLAKGKHPGVIDLLLIGDSLNNQKIASLTEKTEETIQRKIRFLILNENEKNNYLKEKQSMLIWKRKKETN